jgi:hypothetical protein
MVVRNENCLLDVLKNGFGEVDEAIYQGVESPYELIFCILCIEKSVSDEFAFYVLSRRMALRSHNLPSGCLKKRLR